MGGSALTSREVLGRWLHRGDPAAARRVAVATRGDDGWSELTYADLDRRSAAVGARLSALGAGPGDTVGLLGDAGGDWTVAFLGILRAGAVAVPFDAKLTAGELAPLARRSRLAAAIVSPALAPRWAEAGAGVPVLELEGAGGAGGDGEAADAAGAGGAGASATTAGVAAGAPVGADGARSLDDPALVVWTSGTTGAPKGVTLSLGNLAYVVDAALGVQETGPGERWLSVLPPNHLLELCCGLLPALAAGSATFVARTIVPNELGALVREARVNRMVVVPMILRMLKRHLESEMGRSGPAGAYLRAARRVAAVPSARLRRLVFAPVHRRLGGALRTFYCGGAPLDPGIVAFFDRLGIAVYPGYGLTEAAPTVAMNAPGRRRPGSVGRPLPGVDVRISDEGEVLVRSPGVMLGYWDDEAATREAVDAEDWLHTGDLGRLDGDGYLFLTGRAKSLIVLDSGKKVQPEEVEAALTDGHDAGASAAAGARPEAAFAEVCVLGWRPADEPAGGEQVCAVVVPTPSFVAAHPDPAALEEAAAEEVRRLTSGLAGYKRPTLVRVHLGELPKTPKRSVRQAEVRRLLDAGHAARTGSQEVRP